MSAYFFESWLCETTITHFPSIDSDFKILKIFSSFISSRFPVGSSAII